MKDVKHSKSSQVWLLVHQPGDPQQTAARIAVKLSLRSRHPEDVIRRHIDRIDLIIERLEELAKHERGDL